VGLVYEYFYSRVLFSQSSWYQSKWWRYDATGRQYDSSIRDPYEDYSFAKINEQGGDKKGHRITAILTFPLLSVVDWGFRYTLRTEDFHGSLTNTDEKNHDNYADQYYHLYDFSSNQKHKLLSHEFNLGVIYQISTRGKLGLSVGHITGSLIQDISERDTSFFKTTYYTYEDPSKYKRYIREEISSLEKRWDYSGSTNYGELHGNLNIQEDVALRFYIYEEKRSTDLAESEKIWRSMERYAQIWYDTQSEYRTSAWSTFANFSRQEKAASISSD
jgi:hypothetical protein